MFEWFNTTMCKTTVVTSQIILKVWNHPVNPIITQYNESYFSKATKCITSLFSIAKVANPSCVHMCEAVNSPRRGLWNVCPLQSDIDLLIWWHITKTMPLTPLAPGSDEAARFHPCETGSCFTDQLLCNQWGRFISRARLCHPFCRLNTKQSAPDSPDALV